MTERGRLVCGRQRLPSSVLPIRAIRIHSCRGLKGSAQTSYPLMLLH